MDKMGAVNLDDFDDLVHLLQDLVYVGRRTIERKCHTGEAGHFAVPDGQAVNVEAAPPEEAGYAVEDAGLVLHQGHDGVAHG